MTYKLPVEKKLIRGKIEKGVPHGRILRTIYDEGSDRVIFYHATRGRISRNRTALMRRFGK